MIRFDTALVVDRSAVARQLFERLLSLQAKQIASFASVDEAAARCHVDRPDVVLADAEAEGSLAWFEHWDDAAARPAFVFVTTRPTREEETRVSMLGAIGYLAKPFTYRQLASALASTSPFFESAPPRVRSAPLAHAVVRDPETGDEQIACEIRDLSIDGAFLAAAAPVPVDTPLELLLHLGGQPLAVAARVVRIQDPGWGVTPGWGVAFAQTPESRSAIDEFVQRKLEAEESF